jgi:hypothetical protein
MAREIDGGEQKIADFARGVGCAAIERGFDFVGFLADFVPRADRSSRSRPCWPCPAVLARG